MPIYPKGIPIREINQLSFGKGNNINLLQGLQNRHICLRGTKAQAREGAKDLQRRGSVSLWGSFLWLVVDMSQGINTLTTHTHKSPPRIGSNQGCKLAMEVLHFTERCQACKVAGGCDEDDYAHTRHPGGKFYPDPIVFDMGTPSRL